MKLLTHTLTMPYSLMSCCREYLFFCLHFIFEIFKSVMKLQWSQKILATSKVVSEREELSCPQTRPRGVGGAVHDSALWSWGRGVEGEGGIPFFVAHCTKSRTCFAYNWRFPVKKGNKTLFQISGKMGSLDNCTVYFKYASIISILLQAGARGRIQPGEERTFCLPYLSYRRFTCLLRMIILAEYARKRWVWMTKGFNAKGNASIGIIARALA